MIQIANRASGERYTELKRQIDLQFPAGRVVAVEAGHAIADAPTHPQLVEKLRALGKSPKDMLIVQAGVEYPASATIFATAPIQTTHV
jgi:hypothetical protein